MPAIRPEAISNLVRLSNEARALVVRFVPEDGAVDAVLSAVVDEHSPHKHSIPGKGPQHDLLTGSDEELAHAAIGVSVGAVVAFIEFEAVAVAIFGQPPVGLQGVSRVL